MVICNHVLEHIPSDRKVVAELFRILKPGGLAVLQVPIASGLAHTLEDSSVQTAQACLIAFGQSDHVRLYGGDYFDRLREVGFEVATVDYQAELGGRLCKRYALVAGETIFKARKRPVVSKNSL